MRWTFDSFVVWRFSVISVVKTLRNILQFDPWQIIRITQWNPYLIISDFFEKNWKNFKLPYERKNIKLAIFSMKGRKNVSMEKVTNSYKPWMFSISRSKIYV